MPKWLWDVIKSKLNENNKHFLHNNKSFQFFNEKFSIFKLTQTKYSSHSLIYILFYLIYRLKSHLPVDFLQSILQSIHPCIVFSISSFIFAIFFSLQSWILKIRWIMHSPIDSFCLTISISRCKCWYFSHFQTLTALLLNVQWLLYYYTVASGTTFFIVISCKVVNRRRKRKKYDGTLLYP